MKRLGMISRSSIIGLGMISLGLILLLWGIKGQNNAPNLEVYSYQDITVKEFATLYLAQDLGYSVRLSNSAKEIKKKSSFGAVKGYPIRKVLMLTSDVWGVKFYVRDRNIFVCLPDEQPPADFSPEDTELIYAEPLPVITSLKFSKAKHMCGPNCLALISYALGKPVSVKRVAELAKTNPSKGTTMSGLFQAAESLGLKSKGVKMSLDTYKKVKCPIIIHLDGNGGHYVVLHSYNQNGTFSIIDPPVTRLVPEDELKKQYSGRALFVWK